MTDEDRRKHRRQTRLMQSEASWLQKALFALRKVEDTQDRLADLDDRDPKRYTLDVEGDEVPLDSVEDAIEGRAREILEEVRERRNAM